MSRALFFVAAFLLAVTHTWALYQGPFQPPRLWNFQTSANDAWKADHTVRFIVALQKRNIDQMHDHLLRVSDPRSPSYGQYLSKADLDELYGPSSQTKTTVRDYFARIPGSSVKMAPHSNLMEVKAKLADVEAFLQTKLELVQHVDPTLHPQRAVRSTSGFNLPQEVADGVKFITLNSPLNFLKARGARALKAKEAAAAKERLQKSARNQAIGQSSTAAAAAVTVTGGNEAAQATFVPQCADGTANVYNPPCSVDPQAPTFSFVATAYANDQSNPYELPSAPLTFEQPANKIYCYNTATQAACDGTVGISCSCVAQVNPLPKYRQLKIAVSVNYPTTQTSVSLGSSDFFFLTDVATPRFLSKLYDIPVGLKVRHGSNQSVAEFYGQFYSNADLEKFLLLAGLPNATLPVNHVLGDLPNDQSQPGGEAQLDIEYLMALAPGAETYFYSMSTYNPHPPLETNEDFLAYLLAIDEMAYPPLVHSLSYGDVEGAIFNASVPGSVDYGQACDQKFMEYGLQGLSFLFSSGDDGIGNFLIREEPALACSQAWPAWPASSPYVTSVGGTMMTDQYLPVCQQSYAGKAALPQGLALPVECTGAAETVCSGMSGGVITSGGGFSDFYSRSLAPWQEAAVSDYLRAANSDAYPQPAGYFNTQGRGYPDVATYASNYFIYLDGELSRESGTSASAPVFAAMVTLWNDIRLAHGRPPLGFVAPFLYQAAATHPDAFRDIVTGDNACGVGHSMSTVTCCEQAFAASAGWDAVTGLGSPNFQVLANLVMHPSAFPNLAATVSTTVAQDDSASDDADRAQDLATAALVLGIAAFVLAALALAFLYFRWTKDERAAQLEVHSALLANHSENNKSFA